MKRRLRRIIQNSGKDLNSDSNSYEKGNLILERIKKTRKIASFVLGAEKSSRFVLSESLLFSFFLIKNKAGLVLFDISSTFTVVCFVISKLCEIIAPKGLCFLRKNRLRYFDFSNFYSLRRKPYFYCMGLPLEEVYLKTSFD